MNKTLSTTNATRSALKLGVAQFAGTFKMKSHRTASQVVEGVRCYCIAETSA